MWVWVPQAANAPFFPFLVEATDNKFDAGYVWNVWQLLWKWFKKHDLKFCGHVSDGDSRLRKNDYRLNVGSETAHWDSNSEKRYLLRNGTERHPLLSHHVTITPEGHPILAHQDWMHLMWRLRLQLIDEKHHFVVGNGDICCAVRDLRSVSKECGFKPEDLNWKDKQNWDGCMRIFSQKTLDELMKLIQAGDNRVLPTYAYVSMGYRLLCAWLGEANGATTEQIIHDAAFALAFVHIWRDWVLDSVHPLGTAFLTRETFLDVVTSCNTRILLFPMYRDYFPEFKPHGPYVSSRFSEYVFQFSRMRQTNNVLVSVRGFMQHLRHYNCQLALESETSIELPASRRGVPHSIKRVTPYTLPPGWHLSDNKICDLIDNGISECVVMWRGLLGVTAKLDPARDDFFFRDPLQSFPVSDAFMDFPVLLSNGGSVVVHDELDGPDDGGEVPAEPDVVESDDQQQADALIAALVQKHCTNGGAAGGLPIVSGVSALEEGIGKVIAEFNASIQAGFKDRKLRFRDEKLLKCLTAAGHTDVDWQRFSDDEDLVVDFGDHWEVGNVMDIALLAEEPTEAQQKQAVLDRLPKRYVENVLINDKRAVFLCKYYNEVKKTNHTRLTGHQNKGCQYELPLASDVPYQWVSRLNVTSSVRMPKVASAFRIHSMHPVDLRLTKELFNKHESYGL